MATDLVQITISFDALVTAISGVSLEDKQRMLDLLEEQVGRAEEDAWDHDPVASAEMRQPRDEYAAGDYATLDEYNAGKRIPWAHPLMAYRLSIAPESHGGPSRCLIRPSIATLSPTTAS